jgi:hypothetical protein
LGPVTTERFNHQSTQDIVVGDQLAMHWDYVCNA